MGIAEKSAKVRFSGARPAATGRLRASAAARDVQTVSAAAEIPRERSFAMVTLWTSLIDVRQCVSSPAA